MDTTQKSTINNGLNHDALLSRMQDSLIHREIVPPFHNVEFPLFSSKDELEVCSVYNEKFLHTLYLRAIKVPPLRFKTVGVLQLGDNFLRHATDYSKMSIESHGIIFSEENFFSRNWNVQVYTNEAQEEDRKNRAPSLILNFDTNNPKHMSTFGELSPFFPYSEGVKNENIPSKVFSAVYLPAKFIFYLSW
jgi:hypothetical protein